MLVYLTLQFSQAVAFLAANQCSNTGNSSAIPVTFTGVPVPASTPLYVVEYNTPNGGSAPTPTWRGVGPFTFQTAVTGFTYSDCETNPWSGTAAYALVN